MVLILIQRFKYAGLDICQDIPSPETKIAFCEKLNRKQFEIEMAFTNKRKIATKVEK